VFDGLSPDKAIFSGNSISNKKLYLLYAARHNNVFINLKAAMAKRYISTTCETFYESTHNCDKAWTLCTAKPPYFKNQCIVLHVTGSSWLKNHLTLKAKGKVACQWGQVCWNCSFTVKGDSNTNSSRDFIIIVIRRNIPAIFATSLHWYLAYWQTGSSKFSYVRSAHSILSIFRISYKFSRCVHSVKR